MTADRTVPVPAARVVRWFANFVGRHGEAVYAVVDGRLVATSADGSVARAGLPFDRSYDGVPEPEAFAEACAARLRWAVLLVRKGGFALAAGTTDAPTVSKVGQRHVQGRTKAGGQSQQRFARRRDNQARQAYEAAADHAHRVLVSEFGGVEALVCGGDRAAVDAVLADPRLAALAGSRCGPWLAVPDPRRDVLVRAIADARSAQVSILEAPVDVQQS